MPASRVRESMARHAVAEVVVRFAGTTVALAHVLPGGRFVVGRSRETDCALDLPPFALVESTPHGFVVRPRADADAGYLDAPIEIAFGRVTVAISLTTLDRAPLPRREIERRPFGFGAGSLAVHATLLLVATWLGVPDETTVPAFASAKGRPTRIARFAVAAQTVERDVKPPPTATPITADDTPSPNPAIEEPADASVDAAASTPTPSGRGDERAPATAGSQESIADGATERRFDPDANPAFDTVKVGPFTTVATGAAAGAAYQLAGENGQRKPLIVISCDASSCLILGGDPKSGVREALEARLGDIVGCYEQHAAAAGKKVELDFGIDERGKVDTVNVGGVGDYDACVATIINSLELAPR